MSGNNKEREGRSNLKQYVYVVRQLASREIKHGNASKRLGHFWNVINPLVTMFSMVLIFGTAFHRDIREFIPYVFTGVIIYSFYNSSMSGSLKALSGNKALLIRTKIPRNLLVIEKVYVSFVRLLFSLVGYAAALIITKTAISPHIALVPVMLALSIIIMLGIGKMLAVINVYFADISYFYKLIMRLVFFASALFYNAEKLSPAMQQVIMYNPIYLSISFARTCILYHSFPEPVIWIRVMVYAAVTYLLGSLIFKKGSQDVVAKL